MNISLEEAGLTILPAEKRIKPSPTDPPISDPTASTQSTESPVLKVESDVKESPLPKAESDVKRKSVVKAESADSLDVTYPPEGTCAACLGLLQLDHLALTQKAKEIYERDNYILGEKSFVISMRLPAQLAIRQRSGDLMVESHQRFVQWLTSKQVLGLLNRSALQIRRYRS